MLEGREKLLFKLFKLELDVFDGFEESLDSDLLFYGLRNLVDLALFEDAQHFLLKGGVFQVLVHVVVVHVIQRLNQPRLNCAIRSNAHPQVFKRIVHFNLSSVAI
jgi:hypothetical protein